MAEDDLLSTLQPPPPAITQLSPLGQFGAALSGAAAGARGQPNPVLERIQGEQEAQFRQQVQMLELRRRVQDQRERRDRLRMSIVERLRTSSDPNAQQFYQKEMSEYAQRQGIHGANPEWFKATQAIPKDELTDINDLIVGKASDEEILARYPSLKHRPGWLQTQKKILENPRVRGHMGYTIDDDPVAAAEKKQAEHVKNWITSHPAYEKQGSDLYVESNRLFRKVTGRHLHTSTPDDEALVDQVTEQGLKILADREAAKKKAEADQKRMDRTQERIDKQRDRPLPVPAGGAVYDKTTKELYTFGVVSVGDVQEAPTRYTTLNPTQKALHDFIGTTDMQLDLSEKLVNLILTTSKDKGMNLARALDLAIKGKLGASPELSAFLSINADLALELARALSGGGQLRVTVLKLIEKDIMPTTLDTIETAGAKLKVARRTLHNRRALMLGEKPEPFDVPTGPFTRPQAGQVFDRPVRVRERGGRTGTLPPNTPLPAGVEVIQ